jgi:peptide/nickel transport system ATP-binding protein
LCGEPGLVIADEPTSALDVTVQREILDLLLELTTQSKTSLIFISHDLAVINQMTSRVLVMHQGLLVEQGDTASVFAAPKDPYTDRLVSSAKRSAMALRELTGGPR